MWASKVVDLGHLDNSQEVWKHTSKFKFTYPCKLTKRIISNTGCAFTACPVIDVFKKNRHRSNSLSVLQSEEVEISVHTSWRLSSYRQCPNCSLEVSPGIHVHSLPAQQRVQMDQAMVCSSRKQDTTGTTTSHKEVTAEESWLEGATLHTVIWHIINTELQS